MRNGKLLISLIIVEVWYIMYLPLLVLFTYQKKFSSRITADYVSGIRLVLTNFQLICDASIPLVLYIKSVANGMNIVFCGFYSAYNKYECYLYCLKVLSKTKLLWCWGIRRTLITNTHTQIINHKKQKLIFICIV